MKLFTNQRSSSLSFNRIIFTSPLCSLILIVYQILTVFTNSSNVFIPNKHWYQVGMQLDQCCMNINVSLKCDKFQMKGQRSLQRSNFRPVSLFPILFFPYMYKKGNVLLLLTSCRCLCYSEIRWLISRLLRTSNTKEFGKTNKYLSFKITST